MKTTRIGYWSAGITSAIACKVGLEQYDNMVLYYIDTGKVHPDNDRFKSDCEQWYGQEIITVKNSKGYKNPIDVIYKTGMVNHPQRGAACTQLLKKEVRFDLERLYALSLFNDNILTNQIFGFEWEQKEVNRAIRFMQQYDVNPLFPLIERRLTKSNCADILQKAGITLPAMYQMGYSNNNCIGCLKGGMGYWNKIRVDFPETFEETAIAERHAGFSCINGVFLDELSPTAGRKSKIIMPECGNFCDIELADIPVKNLDDVLSGKISIYEAA